MNVRVRVRRVRACVLELACALASQAKPRSRSPSDIAAAAAAAAAATAESRAVTSPGDVIAAQQGRRSVGPRARGALSCGGGVCERTRRCEGP